MRFRDLHSNIKIRLVESFITNVLGFMIFPFMAIYFSEQYGDKMAGVMLGFNIFIGLIANFYGGYFADRIGRRKVMLIAEVVRFFSHLVMALANSPWFHSPLLTFFMMLMVSICSGLSLPAGSAMVIDVSSPEDRKFVYSIDYWSRNMAITVGGIAGGFMFTYYRFELFSGVAAMSVVSLILIKFFIKETYFPERTEEKRANLYSAVIGKMLVNYRTVFKDRPFLIFTLASIFALSVEFQATNYTGVRLSKEMVNTTLLSFGSYVFQVDGVKMYGLLQAENALIVVALTAFVTKFVKRYRDASVLIVGILLNAGCFWLFASNNMPWMLLLLLASATIGEMMYWPIRQAFLADMAPADNRSSYMAVNQLVVRGATMLGSLAITIGGFLPAWAMGLLFLFTGLLSIYLFRVIMPNLDQRRVELLQEGTSLNS